jgi:1,4-alpha-glucan branching enzyme
MQRLTRIALVTAIAAAVACAARLRPAAPAPTAAGVRFVVQRPGARSVAVAGTFNEWSAAAHPMTATDTIGIWTATVPLPAGDHRFMYVVDGTEWVSPPHADEYEDDGFGSRNGVINVPPR